MPWYITVLAALGALIAAGFLLLGTWIGLHEPAVARQYTEAFAREHEARAAERVLEEAAK